MEVLGRPKTGTSPRPPRPLSSSLCILVRSMGHELDATARFAPPVLAVSSECRPSAPESSISRDRPTLPRDGPAGAPAAP